MRMHRSSCTVKHPENFYLFSASTEQILLHQIHASFEHPQHLVVLQDLAKYVSMCR